MQVMWMVLVSLGLALGGILGLAVITQVTAWARRRDFSPPRPCRPWLEWRSGAHRALNRRQQAGTSLLSITRRLRTILRIVLIT